MINMKNKLWIIGFFMITLSLQAQPPSIMQEEYLNHQFDVYPSAIDNHDQIIGLSPLRRNAELTHAVFGYLPDWEYNYAYPNLRYDLLTHISVFSFDVSAQGSFTYPGRWPWTDLINQAHQNGVKVIATVVNFTTASIKTLMTQEQPKQTMFSNLKTILETYKLDGVNIDFENVASEDRSKVNTFMTELKSYLDNNLPGMEVSFAAPAVNWGGWNLKGLANACDYLFVMGYDFYGSWSTTSGPVAPLAGGSYHITNTVTSQYNGIPGEKLILGAPYYGRQWETETENAYSKVVKYIKATYFRDDYTKSLQYGVQWDNTSRTPWYRFQQNGKWYQTWFDNDSSLSLKYQLAKSKSWRGVGMWALGEDGSRTELWELLETMFTGQTGLDEIQSLPSTPPVKVYPNPASQSVSLEFYLPQPGNVNVTLSNLLGQTVWIQNSIHLNSGPQELACPIASLPSGIYFFTLCLPSGTQSGKFMILH
ncbi:MAG: T9SS type A sorting domain-containing protein [Candidatus Delongbacteria bacterium]|nr:T9SS type A sorting domain-containing protein [Candidatus Delongbacteria bacterium]